MYIHMYICIYICIYQVSAHLGGIAYTCWPGAADPLALSDLLCVCHQLLSNTICSQGAQGARYMYWPAQKRAT